MRDSDEAHFRHNPASAAFGEIRDSLDDVAAAGEAPVIAVIIPFFQREPGLLAQCVRSILDQPDAPSYRIIVVDDGSPIAAEAELAELVPVAGDRLRIIRQTNAGPGAARNRGLDEVPPGTRYVAFLDSDDTWRGPFLADAVHALDRGYELFFGNSTRVGKQGTRFDWDRLPELNIRAAEHPASTTSAASMNIRATSSICWYAAAAS